MVSSLRPLHLVLVPKLLLPDFFLKVNYSDICSDWDLLLLKEPLVSKNVWQPRLWSKVDLNLKPSSADWPFNLGPVA